MNEVLKVLVVKEICLILVVNLNMIGDKAFYQKDMTDLYRAPTSRTNASL
jgi:hypothetical protein